MRSTRDQLDPEEHGDKKENTYLQQYLRKHTPCSNDVAQNGAHLKASARGGPSYDFRVLPFQNLVQLGRKGLWSTTFSESRVLRNWSGRRSRHGRRSGTVHLTLSRSSCSLNLMNDAHDYFDPSRVVASGVVLFPVLMLPCFLRVELHSKCSEHAVPCVSSLPRS